jgi:hypothetical protein
MHDCAVYHHLLYEYLFGLGLGLSGVVHYYHSVYTVWHKILCMCIILNVTEIGCAGQSDICRQMDRHENTVVI